MCPLVSFNLPAISNQFPSTTLKKNKPYWAWRSETYEASDQQERGMLCSLSNYRTGKTNLSEMRCGWAIDLFIQSTYSPFPQHLLALPVFLLLWHATAGRGAVSLTSWKLNSRQGPPSPADHGYLVGFICMKSQFIQTNQDPRDVRNTGSRAT